MQDGSVHSDSTKIKSNGIAARKGSRTFSYKGKALKNVYYVFPTKEACTAAKKSIKDFTKEVFPAYLKVENNQVKLYDYNGELITL